LIGLSIQKVATPRVAGSSPAGIAIALFALKVEDQDAEPEEGDAADPDQFKRGLERRGLDRRITREGHDDEGQVQNEADPAAREEQQFECGLHALLLSQRNGAGRNPCRAPQLGA
jgi:hypothetical protein